MPNTEVLILPENIRSSSFIKKLKMAILPYGREYDIKPKMIILKNVSVVDRNVFRVQFEIDGDLVKLSREIRSDTRDFLVDITQNERTKSSEIKRNVIATILSEEFNFRNLFKNQAMKKY